MFRHRQEASSGVSVGEILRRYQIGDIIHQHGYATAGIGGEWQQHPERDDIIGLLEYRRKPKLQKPSLLGIELEGERGRHVATLNLGSTWKFSVYGEDKLRDPKLLDLAATLSSQFATPIEVSLKSRAIQWEYFASDSPLME